MNETQKKFCKNMTNWLLFKAYTIQKLPLALLTGFKIVELDESKCITRVKYSYLNKNPFRSTFWAVLGMAANCFCAQAIWWMNLLAHTSQASWPASLGGRGPVGWGPWPRSSVSSKSSESVRMDIIVSNNFTDHVISKGHLRSWDFFISNIFW